MKKSTKLRSFPERLQKAVDDSGLTDVEIGRRCGRNRKTIFAYRHGECTPDCLTLSRLCLILNVSSDFLLFGKESKENERVGS